MSNRAQKRWLVAGFVVAAAATIVVWSRSADRDVNVIILTVDTLRADRLGAYGGPAQTPNIDGLARDGILFLNATTPLPRTTPALASLFTGLWPHHHGSREVGEPLAEVTTLAEVLQRRGYATVAVSANGAAGPNQHLDRGFDEFVVRQRPGPMPAPEVTEHGLDLLARVDPDRPLMMWLHYVDPHYPYIPPFPWKDEVETSPCRELIRYTAADRRHNAHVVGNRDGRSAAALEDCLELYDTVVTHVDSYLGTVLLELERANRLDNSILVFTADHGENMGEWGLYYQHGPNLHDASLRIPLIIAGRGIGQGVDERVIRLEDLTPTLLSLIGEPRRNWRGLDGMDLSRRLRPWTQWLPGTEPTVFAESGSALLLESYGYLVSGRARERNCTNGPRFSLCGAPGEELRLYDHEADPDLTVDVSLEYPGEKEALLAVRRRWPPEAARQRAARDGRFKLVEFPRFAGGYRRKLYDLKNDPSEQRDVSAQFPQARGRLERALQRWTHDLPTSQAPELSPRELDTLRALGYIE